MTATVFGIRHHGPGSARALMRALAELEPDAVLVEGPPEADAIAALAAEHGMRPPVAVLVYAPDDPKRAVFYPFATFSPEWQALRYAVQREVPFRFIDLPVAHWIAEGEPEPSGDAVRIDPLAVLAEAAGHGDPERWWEDVVEHRRDELAAFDAVAEAIGALREGAEPESEHEARREAHMRRAIRAAEREGRERIAVVCGAWHVPALRERPTAAHDDALLRRLPRTKVAATWVPWTYDRLGYHSGYGAGVASPGWYDHMFTVEDDVVIRWLARTAQLLRGQDLDISSAHLVEALRTAEALAALRGRPLAGLPEITEATAAVIGAGADEALSLIHDRLIVGERLGEVPEETPAVPLQADVAREQRRLRLRPEASAKRIDLDLRAPNDRARSHLLHRLALLGIEWGEPATARGARGTFHELWDLRWEPEFAVRLIEASMWGSTLPAACEALVRARVAEARELPALTRLVEATLLADLPAATLEAMRAFEARAAVGSAVPALMDALPPLARVVRYGNVRDTDATAVAGVVEGLVVRIAIGLGGALSSLDDDAAADMARRIGAVHGALGLIEREALTAQWHGSLARAIERDDVHGLVSGRAVRLLADAGQLSPEDAARRLSLALSPGSEAVRAAAWIEGFVSGAGLVLVHDDALLGVLDGWISAVGDGRFTSVLPVLRRTFATFAPAERRQIGERVRHGDRPAARLDGEVDHERARQVLPLLARILGAEDA